MVTWADQVYKNASNRCLTWIKETISENQMYVYSLYNIHLKTILN